jgi:hypothetical protein
MRFHCIDLLKLSEIFIDFLYRFHKILLEDSYVYVRPYVCTYDLWFERMFFIVEYKWKM